MAAPSLVERLRSEMPSWVLSLTLHAVIFAVLATITWAVLTPAAPDTIVALGPVLGEEGGGQPQPGEGRESPRSDAVPMPKVPTPKSLHHAAPDLASDAPAVEAPADAVDPMSDLMSVLTEESERSAGEASDPLLQGIGDDTRRHIGTLRKLGLDVVLVLDATDSMSPYIKQAKKRLHDILKVITRLVPKARVGIVAYKDYGDEYGFDAVKWKSLTDDKAEIHKIVDQITPGGGADIPEPIHEALKAATDQKMKWGRGRRRVVILVGDSPCHATGRDKAFRLARTFARPGSSVHVIDVGGAGEQADRRDHIQPDLAKIAEEGKGSAFLLTDAEAFWEHLIVSVISRQYERDVKKLIKRILQEGP